ncbi:MAG: MFS transporter [Rhodobacteraceae bacterium]|nr:MFS transporter [Paracoccaceae bacterium]
MNLSALTTKPFRHYLIGNAISLHGLWVQKITIGWMAWEATGSTAFLGWLAFLNYAPPLFLGPFFGVVVDRVNIRRAAMTTQTLFTLGAFVLLGIHMAGLSGRFSLSAVALMIGLVTSAQHPIRMAITPRLAPNSQLPSVVLLLSLNFNIARVVGPAIGGGIIAAFGLTAALVFTIVAFVPFIYIVSTLSPRPNKPKPKASMKADFTEGLSYVLRSRFIRTATLITGLFSLAGRGALEILPSIADGVFQRGAAGLGTLTAAAGIGALLAAAVQILMRGPVKGRMPKISMGAAIVGPLAAAGLGIIAQWEVVVFIVGFLGFTGTLVGVGMQSAIQMQVEDHLRGRVMSLWIMVAMGGTAFGSLLVGGMADALGLALALQITGISTAFAVLTLLILRRIGQIRESR